LHLVGPPASPNFSINYGGDFAVEPTRATKASTPSSISFQADPADQLRTAGGLKTDINPRARALDATHRSQQNRPIESTVTSCLHCHASWLQVEQKHRYV
jgi:hypothetical protein